MERARRHQRLLSGLAFALLALSTELIGRSLTHRVDVGRHVAAPSYANTDYYPILLGVVKGAIALMLARLLWRVLRARATERIGLRATGGRAWVPRVRLVVSPRLCLSFFLLTSVIFLVQHDAEFAASGRWPLLAPWLHSSALPVFAVLSVVSAVVWSVAREWLADYEEHAHAIYARAVRLAARGEPRLSRPSLLLAAPPRRIFGLAFECRPPPLAA